MKKIAFYNIYEELNRNNFLFENTNTVVGDDLLRPFVELKKYADNIGLQVFTMESHRENEADAYVFIDMPRKKNIFFKKAVNSKKKLYLILFESELVKKDNYVIENHSYFDKIFTHNDSLVDNKKYFKINFSHTFPDLINKDFSKKEKLCTLIAGNKRSNHPLELYSKRIEAIQWFETNHPEDFDLYGIGWDKYTFHGPKPVRLLNRIKFLRRLITVDYPSYKGPIGRKRDTLEKYKFSICYENARDIPGYITEKIFDCFFAGCVPVYWGAGNISDFIPIDCFIDKRDFDSYESLYDFIKYMSNEDYITYLTNIELFLRNPKSFPFTSDYFVKTVMEGISNE